MSIITDLLSSAAQAQSSQGQSPQATPDQLPAWMSAPVQTASQQKDANRNVQTGDTYEEHDPRHTGVAGIARTILGTLGDFLLTRLHMPAMYAPAQQQREIAAAGQGINSSDPQQQQSALNRVSGVDFSKGQSYQNTITDNNRLAAQQAATMEARNSRLAIAQETRRDTTKKMVASYFNGIVNLPPDKQAEAYANGRRLQLNSASIQNDPELKQELSDLYPETYDPLTVSSSIGGSVPVATQWAQAITSHRDANHEADAERSDTTANRGITVRADTAKAEQGVQTAGQQNTADIAAANRDAANARAGQTSADRRRGQTLRYNATTRGQNMRPHAVQEGEVRTIGGVTYKIVNGKAVAQ